MNEIQSTLSGNATKDVDLRFTGNGKAVASFTLASTPRTKDGDQWVDGETSFIRVTVWGKPAEHVAESIQKGTRVVVSGRLSSARWTSKDGEERTGLELTADLVGVDLSTQVCQVSKSGTKPVQRGGEDPWAGGGRNDSAPW